MSDIKEQRDSWVMGVLTGAALMAVWHSHSWEPLIYGLVGLYGLVDVKALNDRKAP